MNDTLPPDETDGETTGGEILLRRTELRLAGAREQLSSRLAEIQDLQTEIGRIAARQRATAEELAAVHATKSYRLLQPARRLYGKAREVVATLRR